jgi:hypothetical protein
MKMLRLPFARALLLAGLLLACLCGAHAASPYERRWTENPAWCRNTRASGTDELPITITRRSIETFASSCRVLSSARKGVAWVLRTSCRDEGQTETDAAHPGHGRPWGTANETKSTVAGDDPHDVKLTLEKVGGSRSNHWNRILASQTVRALWLQHSDPEMQKQQYRATMFAMVGIGPKDELEGMLAAQLVAAHSAVMECYRRAMIRRSDLLELSREPRPSEQAFPHLCHAARNLEPSSRKGQQKVTVEHVHVHEGGAGHCR